mmetsp:Transcript_24237/g.49098  ORF Transcript_24237/g.49098 Transcript_24237/m.49098 type:complete len:83 (+) Transcript_24237:968-1216(+)
MERPIFIFLGALLIDWTDVYLVNFSMAAVYVFSWHHSFGSTELVYCRGSKFPKQEKGWKFIWSEWRRQLMAHGKSRKQETKC